MEETGYDVCDNCGKELEEWRLEICDGCGLELCDLCIDNHICRKKTKKKEI